MTTPASPFTRVSTVVVPIADQERSRAFYVDQLGMRVVNDIAYATGERWLEVSPGDGSANLCLVVARPERPAGVDTGVILLSTDAPATLEALRARGVDVDDELLREGEVVWWSGAPLAGRPPQFRFRDPDGNSYLVVTAT